MPIDAETLSARSSTLLIFVDETGNEDFSDPKHPVFGRGGCVVFSRDYQRLIKRPWRTLKRNYLGGVDTPFHATDFEALGPTNRQIFAINRFMKLPFRRFAAMSDDTTSLPKDIDGHAAISLVIQQFTRQLALATKGVSDVALIFESSHRTDPLVKRDFNLNAMNLKNSQNRPIEVNGYFMPKSSMEPGLEVADLIAHTAGRQRRHERQGRVGHVLDFQKVFHHSPIPPEFISIQMLEENK